MLDRGAAPTARERAAAYLSAFLDGDDLTHAVAEVDRRRRVVRTVPRTLRTAHTVLREHVRVAPDAAAFTLVTDAGLPPDAAAAIVGLDPARLRLILSQEGVASGGRRTSWVGARPARRDLLWPGVTTVWLAVIALAILPADGVARGPATLLTQPRAQLALSAVSAARPQAVQPGGRVHVTVAVMNGGPDTAEDVNVRLRAPDVVSPVADSGMLTVTGQGDGAGGALDVARLLSDAGVTVDTIPAGSAAQLEAQLQVPGDASDGTELGMVAQVSVPAFGELESSRAVSTVRARPELTVDLSVSPSGAVAPGDRLTWNVRLVNVGTVAAGSVSIHGELPPGLSFLDGSALVDGRAPSAPTDNGSMGVSIGDMAAGETRNASFETLVTAQAAGDVIEHRVRAVYGGADDPARSEPVQVEVGVAELADTGLRLWPAALLALILLTTGVAMLTRRPERAS